MSGWRHRGILDDIQGGLALFIAPLVIGSCLIFPTRLGALSYAFFAVFPALVAIFLTWKGRPNSGAFVLIALYLCGGIFTGTAFDVVYAAFYVNAIWTAFGCFILGVAITQSGLIERLADRVIRIQAKSYARLIVGLVVFGVILSLLVPTAIARVFLILPMVIALADALGYQPHSRGRTGLLIAAIFGALVPAFAILPATVSGIVLLGSAEKLFSFQISYGDYFLANFPAMILPATLVATLLLIYFFREQPAERGKIDPSASGPLSSREIGTLIIALSAVILWATDPLHGLPLAWIAMGAATLCLLPVVGPLRKVTVLPFIRVRTWVLLFGVLGALTIANLTGIGETVSDALVTRLDFSRAADGSNYAILVALAMVVSVVFTVQAAPAVFSVLATNAGLATGWPIEGILMSQVAAWVVLFLPHVIPGLWIGLSACGLHFRQVMAFAILYFLIGVLVILPLQFQWLRFLNYIP